MVKVFVDKVDGDIVFTHYLEENDKNRKYTLVFNVRRGEILEHSKGLEVCTFFSRHAKQVIYFTWKETGKIPKVLESEWM